MEIRCSQDCDIVYLQRVVSNASYHASDALYLFLRTWFNLVWHTPIPSARLRVSMTLTHKMIGAAPFDRSPEPSRHGAVHRDARCPRTAQVHLALCRRWKADCKTMLSHSTRTATPLALAERRIICCGGSTDSEHRIHLVPAMCCLPFDFASGQ